MKNEQKENTANIVTIYKVTCVRGYQMIDKGSGFSLRPWGVNTAYFEGYDDGGKDYELPPGYEIAESKSGSLEIYDPRGSHCRITNDSGKPRIVSNAGAITLKPVKK